MITAAVLLALLVVAMIVVMPAKSSFPAREPAAAAQSTPPALSKSTVQTVVVRQDSIGYTNADLTPATLKLIQAELIRGTLQRSREHLASQGLSLSDVTPEMVTASSWIMETDGKRFGIVNMLAGTLRIKVIIAIQGGEFVRVSCMDPSGKNITAFTGPCADRIKEVFGVNLPTSS